MYIHIRVVPTIYTSEGVVMDSQKKWWLIEFLSDAGQVVIGDGFFDKHAKDYFVKFQSNDGHLVIKRGFPLEDVLADVIDTYAKLQGYAKGVPDGQET